MTKSNSNKIVELYPEMFTFTMRGYEHNIFEKGYNKALAYIQFIAFGYLNTIKHGGNYEMY